MDIRSEKLLWILVAAKPGIMRNSLVAYLRTISNLPEIALADDAAAAAEMIRKQETRLVIVNSDVSESEMLNLIRLIQAERPRTWLIVLIESIRQQQLCLNFGAHYAFLKGFLDEQLRQAVVGALREEKET